MKKLIAILCLLVSTSYGQKLPNLYVRVTPFAISTIPVYSSTGTSLQFGSNIKTGSPILGRLIQNVEVGYAMGILDMGIAIGKIQKDWYVESRFSIDGFQVGNFSNEYTIGIGYVNNSSPLMLEATSTIMVQASPHVGVGLVTGYIDFAGNVEDISRTYFGIYLRYGLLRLSDGTLKKHRTI